jgi:hypothetical protein
MKWSGKPSIRLETTTEKTSRLRSRTGLLLFSIFFIALFFRLYHAGGTFFGRDDAIVQLFALDSVPADGFLQSFTRLEHAALGNPLRLAAYPLSVVLPVLAFLTALVSRAFSIPLTELTWVVPISLLGAATVFPAHRLLRRLCGDGAALTGTALLAVIPLHVLVSRSLAAAWVPAFFMEIVTLLALQRAVDGRKWGKGLLSASLTIYLLCHNQFPSFAPVLFAAAVIFDASEDRLARKCRKALRLLTGPRVSLAPALALLALLGMHIGFTYFYRPAYRSFGTGVGLVGHMLHRGTQPGLYFRSAAAAALYALGPALLALCVFALAAWLAGIGRDRKTLLFPLWSAAYLFPFFFFLSPQKTIVTGYMGDGLYPLVFLGAAVLARFFRAGGVRKWAAAAFLAVVFAFSVLCSTATVFRLDWPAWIRMPQFHGSVEPDTGIKAAGTWFRSTTAEEASLFSVSIDPKLARYYTHRRVYGVLDGTVDEARQCFSGVAENVDFLLLPAGLKKRFRIDELPEWKETAVVVDGSRKVLEIFSRSAGKKPTLILQRQNNDTFDAAFANLPSLSRMPDYVPCKGVGAMK